MPDLSGSPVGRPISATENWWEDGVTALADLKEIVNACWSEVLELLNPIHWKGATEQGVVVDGERIGEALGKLEEGFRILNSTYVASDQRIRLRRLVWESWAALDRGELRNIATADRAIYKWLIAQRKKDEKDV